MHKLKIVLTASIAAVLTLSCSNTDILNGESSNSNGGGNESSSSGDQSGGNNGGGNKSSSSGGKSNSSNSDGGDGSGSFIITKVYNLLDKTDKQFTYLIESVYDHCTDGGVFKSEEDNWPHTINYSINNKTMTWQNEWSHSDDDTLNFKGTSNELIGTWIRTKNRDASCEVNGSWRDCKDDWQTTKVVLTETKVEITLDICYTDKEMVDGGDEGYGWKWRVVDCNTAELYKGTDIITMKITINDINEITYSYKGESCSDVFEPSISRKQAACREAWDKHQNDEYWNDYYWDFLRKDFNDCMVHLVPPELIAGDDEYDGDSYGKVAAKPLAKAKAKTIFPPLLKKKN